MFLSQKESALQVGSSPQGKNLFHRGANSFLEEVTLLGREAKRGKIAELLHLKMHVCQFNIIQLI